MSGGTVLIVATDFPPATAVGGLRLAKLCNYLPLYGWRSVVVTVAPSARTPLRDPVSDRLLQPLQAMWQGPEYEVHRVWGPNPIPLAGAMRRWFASLLSRSGDSVASDRATADLVPRVSRDNGWAFQTRRGVWAKRIAGMMVPDEYAGWIAPAVVQSGWLARRCRARVVLNSYPTASGAVAAAMVSRITRLPLVVDFRDAWMDRTPAAGRGPRRRELERTIERAVLSRASGVTAVNLPILHKEVGGHLADKVTAVIPQGWDPAETQSRVRDAEYDDAGCRYCEILYAGTLDPGVSNPAGFLSALRDAAQTVSSCPPVRVTFVGQQLMDVAAVSTELGIEHMVRTMSHVPRGEVLQLLAGADLLLLIRVHPGDHWITGKIWDYITVRRPILGVVDPRSAAAEIITRARIGRVIAPWDESGLRAGLRSLLAEFAQTGAIQCDPRPDELDAISAPAAARAMAEVLDEVSDSGLRSLGRTSGNRHSLSA